MRTSRTLCHLVLGATLCAPLWLAACHNTKGDKIGPEADNNSGPDANRSGAVAILPNRDYTDRVDIAAGDMTDWKSLELTGRPGALEVTLHWDSNAADLAVDAFDAKGTQIASSPLNNGTTQKRMAVVIDTLGVYYLRVAALTPKAGSDYTLVAKWDVAPVEPPPPPQPESHARPRPPREEHKPAEHHEAAPRPKRGKGGGSPESGLQGRIVSAQKAREGDGMTLYIDKGRAAGVAEGQNGWILEGSSGASPLDGGTFTITTVVDEARSIGKTGLRSIGKNNRVSINTGK